MKIVVAPDGFGGSLSPREAADAIRAGWIRGRPGDDVELVPMSDGGEGLIAAITAPGDTWVPVEVAGPLGHPQDCGFLLRSDGAAVIESALACGLALVPPERRTPLSTTTYGVGQLIDAARRAGATRIRVGLGGSATVDGGSGALMGLGFRLRVADGSGLKVGGDALGGVSSVDPGWSRIFSDLDIELLVDVGTPLLEAPRRFGPQKGARAGDLDRLTASLTRWAEVVELGLGAPATLREQPGTGAAGGLAYGLAAGIGARIVPGAERVGELVGLTGAVSDADVLVTGEGRLDATSRDGKVVEHVAAVAKREAVRVVAVVGQLGAGAPSFDDVEVASPNGPGPAPAAELADAAARLAVRTPDARAST